MPRLSHDRPGYTYACPACDGSTVYERTGNGNARDDKPFRCSNAGCGVSLCYVIERPKKNHSDGQATLPSTDDRRHYSRELAATGPEDLGLSPIGVRRGQS